MTDGVRVDKWLWAARIFKSRALAVEAVTGGRVHVGGRRVKPSKELHTGEEIEVNFGQGRRLTVTVEGLAERRGPAAEAALLYEETPESREARERHAAERRVAASPDPRGGSRPTKRDRRRLDATPGSRRGRR